MTVAREWVDLYEDLHEHPELSFQEERTARIVADKLAAFGYEVTTGVGRTGAVGLLRNGDGPLVRGRPQTCHERDHTRHWCSCGDARSLSGRPGLVKVTAAWLTFPHDN